MALLMRNLTVAVFAVFAGLILLFLLNPAAIPKSSAFVAPTKTTANQPKAKSKPKPAPAPAVDQTKHVNDGKFNGTWDAARDARNLLLTSTQCEQAFPGLFDELDKQVARTKKAGTVTRAYMAEVEATSGDAPGCTRRSAG